MLLHTRFVSMCIPCVPRSCQEHDGFGLLFTLTHVHAREHGGRQRQESPSTERPCHLLSPSYSATIRFSYFLPHTMHEAEYLLSVVSTPCPARAITLGAQSPQIEQMRAHTCRTGEPRGLGPEGWRSSNASPHTCGRPLCNARH